MPLSKDTKEWAGLGPRLHAEPTPPKENKIREYLVTTRRAGKSLILTIPAPVRKALSLYDGSLLRLTTEGKAIRITRLETITTAQIEVLKTQYPRAKVPWEKKIHLLGNHHPREQYELRGLPLNLFPPPSSGGPESES